MSSISVYDSHTMDINKYPRLNYKITDIVLITLYMNLTELKKIIECYTQAYHHHNECKDYYFYFEFFIDDHNKLSHTYNAKQIIQIMKEIEFQIRSNHHQPENVTLFLKRQNPLHIILFYYLKNKEFFEKCIQELEKAKLFHTQGKSFTTKFTTPFDFYRLNQSNMYNALELFEIFTYSQYLLKNKIKKHLPFPKYI